jgi:hypothetical protein
MSAGTRLLVILADATSEIYYPQLVEEESTRTVMAALREVIESKGLFCALYSDRGSHFFLTPKAGESVDKQRLTQVGRAMKELGIHMIPAYSPQARGRSERSFGTRQGRLPQELHLASIDTLEEANTFLREHYIAEFNQKFEPRGPDAFPNSAVWATVPAPSRVLPSKLTSRHPRYHAPFVRVAAIGLTIASAIASAAQHPSVSEPVKFPLGREP